MAGRDVIVVGASAGGVEPLIELARGLPPDLPAAVFVVLHLPVDARSHLPTILARAGPLPAVHASDRAQILPGRIYVAPPNRHLVLAVDSMRLAEGPRVNGVRPSIDVLFRSAARAFGSRVIGVVLSGTLSDGALGLDVIEAYGGATIVQDPEEARFPSMPQSVIERIQVDHILPVSQIPGVLSVLSAEAPKPSSAARTVAMSNHPQDEPTGSDGHEAQSSTQKAPDEASGLSCPSCHGSVWELTDGTLSRIECRVGHAFSVDAFLGEQAVALEDAIWAAINSLQERASALRRFGSRLDATSRSAAEYERRAQEVERQAELLREGLIRVIQAETAA